MIIAFLIFLTIIAIIAVVTYVICFGMGVSAIVIVVVGILIVVGCTIAGVIKLINKQKKQNENIRH